MSAERQSPEEREELIRTALTAQIEAWGCMSEFTEAGILYATKVIMERDIDYEGRQMQAIYNRRSQDKKRNEEGEESA